MSRSPGRFATALLLVTITQISATPAPASAAKRCPGADSEAGQVSYAQLGRATLCLLNRERTSRGLKALRANKRLALAARRHADDMVRHSYFAHNSRSGAKFTSRIVKAGYLRGASDWLVAENLAWGAGSGSTPRWIVRTWMNSPGHRANILTRRFRDLGTGVTPGAPVGQRDAVEATFVHEFGVRR